MRIHKSVLWEWDKHQRMLLKNMVLLEKHKTKWPLSHIKKLLMPRKWDGHKQKLLHIKLKFWTRMEMSQKLPSTEMTV
jgi:hypothetical protein